MTSVTPKLSTDDVSLLVVLLDTNPFFWSAANATSLSFSKFLSHVVAFLNSVLLINQLNQVVVIATGINTCDYVYDSAAAGEVPNQRAEILLQKLVEFVVKDEQLGKEDSVNGIGSSLLSGSLSMALCYIQRMFRSGPLHPQPRILCLHGSPDGPEHLEVAKWSSQGSTEDIIRVIEVSCPNLVNLLCRLIHVLRVFGGVHVPMDSCLLGAQHSAFLQQASYITGGVYLKPQQLDGLFQYLSTVFASDLYSRNFLQLPKPVGVDFRASCFCHKNTIDMGYICSVCLSIFCKHHKNCSTCGSVFGQAQMNAPSTSNHKRKTPET